MKPGKPLTFGIIPRENNNLFIFGLPGNPVSSGVTYKMFVEHGGDLRIVETLDLHHMTPVAG